MQTATANFDFLRQIDPVLADACVSAEELAFDKPLDSLTAARRATERLATLLLRHSTSVSDSKDLLSVLRSLEGDRLLTRDAARAMHALRIKGNAAVHDHHGDTRDARENVAVIHRVCAWYATAFHDQRPPAYEPLARSPLAELQSRIRSENRAEVKKLTQELDELRNAHEQMARKARDSDITRQPPPDWAIAGGHLNRPANQTLQQADNLNFSQVPSHEQEYIERTIAHDSAASHLGGDVAHNVNSRVNNAERSAPSGRLPETTASKYEILGKLGRGGMGEVFRAQRIKDGAVVAVKLLHAEFSSSRNLDRFRREADSIKALKHPNIVGFMEFLDDPRTPALVMEFVDGEPLDETLRGSPIPETEALRVFREICEGVEFAHRKQIIHRDIKPANVVLERGGRARVLDFGLARGLEGLELSMTGYGMGTMDYAAPEQKADAKSVDHRADIYSLGAVLYELLSGLKPVPLHIQKLAPRWRPVIAKACEPDATDRHASVTALMEALNVAEKALPPTEIDCPKCGAMNGAHARICHSCNSDLTAICPACGGRYPGGLERCDQCGADVPAVTELKALLKHGSERVGAGQLTEASKTSESAKEILRGSPKLGQADDLRDVPGALSQLIDSRRREASHQRNQAQELLKESRYESALLALEKAAWLDDSWTSEVEVNRRELPRRIAVRDAAELAVAAEARWHAGDHEQAMEALSKATGLDAKHGSKLKELREQHAAHLAKQARKIETEDFRRALSILGEAAKYDERRTQDIEAARKRIAAAKADDASRHAASHDYEVAWQLWRDAAELDEQFSVEVQHAEQSYPKAISRRDAAMLLQQAEVLSRREEYEAALPLLEKAGHLDPESLAQVTSTRSRYAASIRQRDGGKLLTRATELESNEEYEEALKLLELAADKHDDFKPKLEQARESFPPRIAARNKRRAQRRFVEAEKMIAEGQLSKAAMALQEAGELTGDFDIVRHAILARIRLKWVGLAIWVLALVLFVSATLGLILLLLLSPESLLHIDDLSTTMPVVTLYLLAAAALGLCSMVLAPATALQAITHPREAYDFTLKRINQATIDRDLQEARDSYSPSLHALDMDASFEPRSYWIALKAIQTADSGAAAQAARDAYTGRRYAKELDKALDRWDSKHFESALEAVRAAKSLAEARSAAQRYTGRLHRARLEEAVVERFETVEPHANEDEVRAASVFFHSLWEGFVTPLLVLLWCVFGAVGLAICGAPGFLIGGPILGTVAGLIGGVIGALVGSAVLFHPSAVRADMARIERKRRGLPAAANAVDRSSQRAGAIGSTTGCLLSLAVTIGLAALFIWWLVSQ